MSALVLALAAFVGTHFLMSHPLRGPLVARLGEKGFAGVYSLVAAVTLGSAAWAYGRAPVELWWVAPDWAWWLGAAAMLFASVLLVGSVTTPNPSLMGMGGMAGSASPRGVQGITRHPMMWGIALWAMVHAAVGGTGRTVVLALGIGVLALVGAWLQDGKKREQLGAGWTSHAARTSFVPFGRLVSGRAATVWPGWVALGGGVLLFAVATWLHAGLWERFA